MIKRILQPQGSSNSVFARQAILTDEDYLAQNLDDHITGLADLTVVLAKNPWVGQEVLILADGGDVTVIGGSNPLRGSPILVADGLSERFAFNANEAWEPVCCTGGAPTGRGSILQTQIGKVIEAQNITPPDSWVDLVSVPITTTTGSKILITASFSSKADDAQGTWFRLVVDNGSGPVNLFGAGSAFPFGQFEQSGSIIDDVDVTPGTWTVTLQWMTGSTGAHIDPNNGLEHATVVVQELS